MKQQTAINFIEPMKALRVRELPVGNWLYEMKFDGYRALAFKAGKEVRLLSRNRTLFNDNYPVLVDAIKSLKGKAWLARCFRNYFAKFLSEQPSRFGKLIDPQLADIRMGYVFPDRLGR